MWPQLSGSCPALSGAFEAGQIKICRFSQQVVAGMNFAISFMFSGQPYSVRVFRPLPFTNLPLQLVSCSMEESQESR